ncbi:polysaccharide biosynthesis tyrosine autokinase [Deinococcus sp. LM3]|uniref:polysaccharide biosynthesis tyrosine autokinase n=1 Tax=Deinococcus sp. LM3 TaxID=1938608 RepID=UPI000991C7BC|nr:polysaccharide biosynthesis tyrosine autokinase [Deinococcus sp. LM3]OOV15924.1 succinoglycan biosynthesis protein exop [Deinococcus sp. LM3]
MINKRDRDIDVSSLVFSMKRNMAVISLTSLALGLTAYIASKNMTPSYESSAVLLASGSQSISSNINLGDAVITSQPLPEGALQQAIRSTVIINPLVESISSLDEIPLDEREYISQKLKRELSSQDFKSITLESRADRINGNGGIYIIRARARTAEASALIANATSNALIEWDKGRALENIRRASVGYRAQLLQLEEQLDRLGVSSGPDYQTLASRRTALQENLIKSEILASSTNGILSELSRAQIPTNPKSPKPILYSLIVIVLTLMLGVLVSFMLSIFDRTIRSEDDLLEINLPTLATVPRIRRRDIVFSGIVRAGRQAGLYEAMGFLRVNALNILKNSEKPIIMITSTAPGEGKSSVTATLADSFAASGKRVLIVDADLRRGTQNEVWKKYGESDNWVQIVGEGGARNTIDALSDPNNVVALKVEEYVDVLPSGTGLHDSLSLLNKTAIGDAVRLWKANYDIVLIDSAPLLSLADGLLIGQHVDGIIVVVEYGRTDLRSLKSTLRRSERSNLNVIGAVINKANMSEEGSYSYSYKQ